MSPSELNKCLQKFYLSARKRDGSFYYKKSLTAIRAALDRHLRSPPFSKPFSIIGDSQFNDANTSLSNFLKTLSERDFTNTRNGERGTGVWELVYSGNRRIIQNGGRRKQRGNNWGSVTVVKVSFCRLCSPMSVCPCWRRVRVAGLQCHPVKNINRSHSMKLRWLMNRSSSLSRNKKINRKPFSG